jgi:3',5'-cyclic AMP phosphodiesterase CpdA
MVPVIIAQVTDLHITRMGPQARYLFEVIAAIDALAPRPAAVLLSGDLVNDGQREQYAILRDILASSATPVYLVPGNHDRRPPLRAVMPTAYFPGVRGERLNYVLDTVPVRIIGLDTSEPGRPGGFLDAASLRWFDERLAAAPERPALVFMHHPPFRTGVNAADLLGFRGLARFRGIVARSPAVRRVVAGHIHCERHAAIGGALATTSISSAPQRVPELFERRILGLRPEPAGFALHAWHDGAFVSTTYVNAGGGRFVERVAALNA